MVFVIPVTKEEDERLLTYINAHGEGSWRFLPKSTGLNRCGKSCRLRWINYLCPDLKRGNFTLQEDQLIRNLHAVLRNKWSMIVFMFQSPNLLRLMEEIKPVFETDKIEAPIRYLNDLSEVTVLPSMPS